jgi:hypothetical protein
MDGNKNFKGAAAVVCSRLGWYRTDVETPAFRSVKAQLTLAEMNSRAMPDGRRLLAADGAQAGRLMRSFKIEREIDAHE